MIDESTKPKVSWQQLLRTRIHESMHETFQKYAANDFSKTYYSYFGQPICLDNLFGKGKTMLISVIHEDDSENEFDVNFCCTDCVMQEYKLSRTQASKLNDVSKNPNALKIPNNVHNEKDFIAFIKTL